MSSPIINEREINDSIRLSKILFFWAILIELLIVSMGWTASYISGNRSLSIPTLLLSTLALGELTSLWSTEVFAEQIRRKRRYLIKFCSLFAVLIAMSFTVTNLGHIAMIVESHESSKLEGYLIDKNRIEDENLTTHREIEIQKSKILSLQAQHNNDEFLQATKDELDEIKVTEEKIFKNIDQIKAQNFADEKSTQNYLINFNEKKLRELKSTFKEIDDRYLQELEKLQDDRFEELALSSWRQKNNTKTRYDQLRANLDNKYKLQKAPIEKEIDSLNKEVAKAKNLLVSYASLSPESIELIKSQNLKLQNLKSEKEKLVDQKSNFYKDNKDDASSFKREIDNLQQILNENDQQLSRIETKEREFKKTSWLVKLASNYYAKSTSSISLSEFKSFAYYFVLISCIGLALLPKILVFLSVLVKSSDHDDRTEKKDNYISKSINSLAKAITDYSESTKKIKKAKKIAMLEVEAIKSESHKKIDDNNSKNDKEIAEKNKKIANLTSEILELKHARKHDKQITEFLKKHKEVLNKLEELKSVSKKNPNNNIVKKLIPVNIYQEMLKELSIDRESIGKNIQPNKKKQ